MKANTNKISLLILLTILVLSTFSFAKTQPVEAVQQKFEAMYPTATDVVWSKGGDSKVWEGKFILGGGIYTINFNDSGEWLETVKKINLLDLPVAVRKALDYKYPEWLITGVYYTESAQLGKIYEADLQSKDEKIGVAFNEDGKAVI